MVTTECLLKIYQVTNAYDFGIYTINLKLANGI